MIEKQENVRLNWGKIISLRMAGMAAPPLPGVYAFGQVENVAGLPVGIEWVYVGRANNLRRRLGEHDITTESHPGLRDWLLKVGVKGQVWYAPTNLEEAKILEVKLIRAIQPSLNRIKYLNQGG